MFCCDMFCTDMFWTDMFCTDMFYTDMFCTDMFCTDMFVCTPILRANIFKSKNITLIRITKHQAPVKKSWNTIVFFLVEKYIHSKYTTHWAI